MYPLALIFCFLTMDIQVDLDFLFVSELFYSTISCRVNKSCWKSVCISCDEIFLFTFFKRRSGAHNSFNFVIKMLYFYFATAFVSDWKNSCKWHIRYAEWRSRKYSKSFYYFECKLYVRAVFFVRKHIRLRIIIIIDEARGSGLNGISKVLFFLFRITFFFFPFIFI